MESSRHKRPACARCRHMKLKCDAGERFPAGCSRCTKAKKTCSIEPGYKTPSKDDRLEELERELQTLRADMARQRSRSPRVHGSGGGSPNSREGSFDGGSSGPTAMDMPVQIPLIEPRQLEGYEITPMEFDELLDTFFSVMHPAFPFLPDKAYIVRESVKSPLLFWSIVAATSKASPPHAHLYRQLLNPIRRMVMAAAYDTENILQQIQALLILCIWPLPYGATIDDPAWMYCGIITHKALRIGLHRLHTKHEFEHTYRPRAARDRELERVRRNTWAACFIVNHLVSQQHGVPSTMRMDQVLLRFSAETSDAYNPVLRCILQIMQRDHAFSLILGHNETTSDGLLADPLAIIQAYESDLNTLEAQFQHTWTPSIEATFLGSKLRLYTYALMRTSDRDSSEGIRFRAAAGPAATDTSVYLARAYSAAMRIVEISAYDTTEQNMTMCNWATWTSFDLHHLVYATFFLLEITRNWGMSSDNVATNNAIRQAWATFKGCVVAENDLFTRVCDIIEYATHGRLQQSAVDSPDAMPQFLVKSRMGANLIMDLVFRSRSRFDEGQKVYQDTISEVGVPILHSTPSSGVSVDTGIAEFPALAIPPLDAKYFWADMGEMGQPIQYN
ncbi:hypothetical protein GQ53DRAFT_830986 [Thozetella sp. PMI_491]|nr:hypothetical protein GQ53DRAFT_830986 [Thozetella sp. PMI_491]